MSFELRRDIDYIREKLERLGEPINADNVLRAIAGLIPGRRGVYALLEVGVTLRALGWEMQSPPDSVKI